MQTRCAAAAHSCGDARWRLGTRYYFAVRAFYYFYAHAQEPPPSRSFGRFAVGSVGRDNDITRFTRYSLPDFREPERGIAMGVKNSARVWAPVRQ